MQFAYEYWIWENAYIILFILKMNIEYRSGAVFIAIWFKAD